MTRVLNDVLDEFDRIVSYQGADRKLLLKAKSERDLFFFMTRIMLRKDMEHQWVLERCDEVSASPDGYLDLWARAHYKSSISVGLAILDALRNPELCIGIFSHTRPAAKQFLRQIKEEFERNPLIRELWPDVVWQNPIKDAPSWSLDGGIVLNRKGNPKEATFEAWGIVDGQPIGKHFGVCIYDDLMTRDNAASPEMRNKTLGAWELSLNLGINEGTKRRYYGTRYHYNDVYNEIMKRKSATPRIYPAEVDGEPVLLSEHEMSEKRRDMGPVVYAAQMMLDPKSDSAIGFQPEWLRNWSGKIDKANRYILVDPANEKKKKSDYTTLWVVDMCRDGNYYVRHVVRDRLNLRERIALVINMHKEWEPKKVAYEQYGMQADIQALKMEQDRLGYRFEVTPVGGQLSKHERISRLIPLFSDGKVYLPHVCNVLSSDEGMMVDMINRFKHDEFLAWPFSGHDDMLDSLARITDPDLGAVFPKATKINDGDYKMRKARTSSTRSAWAA